MPFVIELSHNVGAVRPRPVNSGVRHAWLSQRYQFISLTLLLNLLRGLRANTLVLASSVGWKRRL
jgi:hypothetical protein